MWAQYWAYINRRKLIYQKRLLELAIATHDEKMPRQIILVINHGILAAF